MKQVTADEFFKVICPLDVILDVQGNYPYKVVFKMRHGDVVGFQDRDGRYYLYG